MKYKFIRKKVLLQKIVVDADSIGDAYIKAEIVAQKTNDKKLIVADDDIQQVEKFEGMLEDGNDE